MKTLTAIMMFLTLTASAFASTEVTYEVANQCGEVVTGKVLKVEEAEQPLYMKFNGDEVEAKKVYVAIAGTEMNRQVAGQVLETFTIHKPIAADETYELQVNNGVICSYQEI
jgi:hypothetical protein